MLRQNIEVTQDKKLVNPAIHVVQGDTGRTVVALVKDATISGTATMAFERPDGTTYTTTATVNSDNSVEATFTADMLRVAGTGKATFKVVSSGSQVSTYQLYVLVEPSAGFERPVTPSNNKIYVYVNGSPVEVATAAEVATKARQSQVDGISATVNNLVGRIVEDESNIAINTATLSNITPKVTKNESDISELKDDLVEVIYNDYIGMYKATNRITKNKILTNSGAEMDFSAFKGFYTDYIDISDIKTAEAIFKINGSQQDLSGCCYDKNKSFVCSVKSVLTNGVFTKPNNVVYARLNGIETNDYENQHFVTIERDIRLSSWDGKVINILGDSITYGYGLTDRLTERYSALLEKRTGATINNFGNSGSKISEISGDEVPSMVERVALCDNNADLNIIFGGTNDYWHHVTNRGDYSTRADTSTLYGALWQIFVYIHKYTSVPKTVFVFPYSQLLGNKDSDYDFGFGTFKDFRDTIKEVCAEWSIPMLDLLTVSNMPIKVNAEKRTLYTQDGVHPTAEGHKVLADKIFKFIEYQS